ncbi:MAG: SIMPL domain-containing protein [Opitutales bacterium]
MKIGILAAAIVSGLIVSALIVAKPWVTIHHTKPIVVKGYAELPIEADTGSLTASVAARGASNAEAYEKAGTLLSRVKEILSQNLKDDSEIEELSPSMQTVMKLDHNGRRTNEIDFYKSSRRLRVTTKNVAELQETNKSLFDLNEEGILVSVSGPEFFVSDLESIKLELVSAATLNGKKRAEEIARNSGEYLGSLVSAKQGVIQITKENSTKTSSYGVYDTETIKKVIKLVVTLEYEIEG